MARIDSYIVLSFMLKIILVVALTGCASSPFFTPPEKVEIDNSGILQTGKGPYQLYLAPGEILIGAEFPKKQKAFLKYWPVDDPNDEKTLEMVNSWESIYYAHVKNLPLSKKYRFSVCIDIYSCEFLSGKAGVRSDEPFKFLVIGDTRAWNHQPHKKMIPLMKKLRAEFYVHLGDMVTYGQSESEWRLFFDIEKPLYQSTPLVPVIGNHDLSRRKIFSRLFFPMSNKVSPERYFSFAYGNSFFLVVDTNRSIPVGGKQYSFMEKELKAASENKNINNLFVFAHHPPYSSGWHGNEEALHETVVKLSEKYGVKAVFAGHDHHYERTKPINGVTYFVSGGGGSPLRNVLPQKFTAASKKTFQFMEISVSSEKINVKSIDVEGKVIDEVAL